MTSKSNTKQHISWEQKEAVGLLSIGTFLEYFDLMIYVHMAVFLNELFFPKTDPHTAALLSAFAFCSTYLLRPFGALIFGWIGDSIGRKVVVIISTFLMAISCVVIATLPTYAQIGITASWILTMCRIVQGLAATAEVRGAEIYITETTKPPIQYPLVTVITVFSALGTTAALGISSMFTNPNIHIGDSNWRLVFLIGAGVALVGTIGRTSIKEADEFISQKKKALSESGVKNEKVHWLTSLSYFLIQCGRPPCFYFIYIYCGDVLRRECGFSANDVINQNFFVSIIDFAGIIGLAYLSYYINPLKILKAKFYLFFFCLVFFPLTVHYAASPYLIFTFQALAALFVFDHVPATPIFYRYFPVLKRFTYTSLLSAVAKLSTYVITSFGLVVLTMKFGYWGLFLIFLPVGISFITSVGYFESLQKKEEAEGIK